MNLTHSHSQWYGNVSDDHVKMQKFLGRRNSDVKLWVQRNRDQCKVSYLSPTVNGVNKGGRNGGHPGPANSGRNMGSSLVQSPDQPVCRQCLKVLSGTYFLVPPFPLHPHCDWHPSLPAVPALPASLSPSSRMPEWYCRQANLIS